MISFIVKFENVAVRVLLVDGLRAVRQMNGEARACALPLPSALFIPDVEPTSVCGTAVFSRTSGKRLLEYVPHEMSHAVLQVHKNVHVSDDEDFAYAVGRLSAATILKLRKLRVPGV